MDARAVLGLEPTESPSRWRLPVTPGISTGGGFLFGGSGPVASQSAIVRFWDERGPRRR